SLALTDAGGRRYRTTTATAHRQGVLDERFPPMLRSIFAGQTTEPSTSVPEPNDKWRRRMRKLATWAAAFVLVFSGAGAIGLVAAQDKPRSGGELIFPVPSEPPSYDAHREETFGVIHPVAPHYNGLLRVDPTDPTGTKPAPDLAESWTVSKDGLAYTF